MYLSQNSILAHMARARQSKKHQPRIHERSDPQLSVLSVSHVDLSPRAKRTRQLVLLPGTGQRLAEAQLNPTPQFFFVGNRAKRCDDHNLALSWWVGGLSVTRVQIFIHCHFERGRLYACPLKEYLCHLGNRPSRGAQAGDTWEGRCRILVLRRYIPSRQRERRTRFMLSRATCPPCTCPSKLSRLCLLRDARRATESARHGSCPRGSTCSPGTW